MNTVKNPVIIVGMHRSGTTMISRLLEEVGLFLGVRKDDNFEARFFHNINLWLFSQSGARWDNPAPFHYLVENREARKLAVNYISDYVLSSPRAALFLGWKAYLKEHSVSAIHRPWGWKSPLNTFTLPVWLDLFPNAKVIHIYRHGVDVANSLRVRNRKDMRRNWVKQVYYHSRALHWVWPKHGEFMESIRCDSLAEGLGLWEEYMAEAQRHVTALGERAVEVKYEEFLADPAPVLLTLARFCEVPVDNGKVERAAAAVMLDRAFAYRKSIELQQFAECQATRLAAQRY